MRTSTRIFRDLQKKALGLAGVVTHAPDFLPFLVAAPGSALGRQLRARPELWGMAVTPFVCADWTVSQRTRTLVEHCRRLDRLPAIFSHAIETDVELMRLEEIGPSCRLVLHQVRSMLREGLLTLSLFDGSRRLFSLSVSFVGEGAGAVAYVGGLQGMHSPVARERYRRMTKTACGLRTRDLMLELFSALCRQLGVTRIQAVSGERHTLMSDYSRRNSPEAAEAPHLNYNDTWRERGGVQVSPAFFELPVAARRRAASEIPARKSKLYASRYLLLDRWESRLAATITELSNPGGVGQAASAGGAAQSGASDDERRAPQIADAPGGDLCIQRQEALAVRIVDPVFSSGLPEAPQDGALQSAANLPTGWIRRITAARHSSQASLSRR